MAIYNIWFLTVHQTYFTVPLNLEEVRKIWLETTSPYNIRRIADHYSIFQDLFGNAFFFPIVPLEINYSTDNNDTLAKVYTGNVLKPAEARRLPNVTYKAQDDTLWTLVMSTPDGNLENSNNEYCHWFLWVGKMFIICAWLNPQSWRTITLLFI